MKNFKKGQRLICTHYKDKPSVKVIEVNDEEVWVEEKGLSKGWSKNTKLITSAIWWGPRSWFRVQSRKDK